MHRRLPLIAVLAFASLAAFTGCTPSPQPDASVSPMVDDEIRDKFAASYELADCLNQKGWDVTVDERDGGVQFEGSTAQMDQYQLDQEECTPESTATLDDLTEAQWHELYTLELDTAQCLRDEGVTVPEAPTEQVFIERYPSAEPWTSYSFVGDVPEDRWYELNEVCPQPVI